MDSSIAHLAIYFFKNPGTVLLADSIFAASLKAPYVLVAAWSFFHMLRHLNGRKSVNARTLFVIPLLFIYTAAQAFSLTHLPLAAVAAFKAADPVIKLPVALFSGTYHRFSVLLLGAFAMMSIGMGLALLQHQLWSALVYVAVELVAEFALEMYRKHIEKTGEQESEFVNHLALFLVGGFLSMQTHQLSSVVHRLSAVAEGVASFVLPWFIVRLTMNSRRGESYKFLPLDYAPLADYIAMFAGVAAYYYMGGGLRTVPVLAALVALAGRTLYAYSFASMEEDFDD